MNASHTSPHSPDVDPDFESLVRSFFGEESTPARVATAEARQGMDAELWGQVVEMGLPLIDIPEQAGGSGGSLPELIVALRAQGAAAAPVPLAETHLASWALSRAQQAIAHGGVQTIVPGDPRDNLVMRATADGDVARLTGEAHAVPWARLADAVVLLLPGESQASLVRVPMEHVQVRFGYDLAGQPKDDLTLDSVPVRPVPWPGPPGALRHRAMLLRSALMAGALAEMADLTRDYVSERRQFGRPIGAFQAVQEHVVHLAQMAAMSVLVVDRAARAAQASESAIEVVMAKLLVNENALIGVRAAHQAHGAIGMTQEYRLQLLTRRLNSWLSEIGAHHELAARVGAGAMDLGISSLITAPAGTKEVSLDQ